jgi:hypothetical protein
MFTQILSKVQQHHAQLIAVSKTHPVEKIRQVYQAGQRLFGENRPQEMLEKHPSLPPDIQWHMIGHLQTNKVKYIAPFVAMIHSVDSLKLLQEINRQAQKHNRIIDCLLQFHIATEETKFGLDEAEAEALLVSPEYSTMHNIRICGVMGMATFTENPEQVRAEFRHLKSIFHRLKTRFFANEASFREISMGMSGDWEIALEEGSTLVRIGSLIFGAR